MFSAEELAALDRSYFSVLCADAYDVTIVSKNTGHVWQLHNVELLGGEITVVFHKHHVSNQFHTHSRSRTLGKAIRDIKSHDQFQLNGRRPVKKKH